ncbi:G1/S-specific cyclin-D3 [Polyrhizophydium stewartii]|uniref:G1/S-specific cyclin-D3 n=1 Tax=Polyrhizophydium stewartii TaxID=2732419 RepID=A0ABR4N2D2_9FUNG|nr:hypothetical protein HK105_003478 [Polyrhizophydium stewartii]
MPPLLLGGSSPMLPSPLSQPRPYASRTATPCEASVSVLSPVSLAHAGAPAGADDAAADALMSLSSMPVPTRQLLVLLERETLHLPPAASPVIFARADLVAAIFQIARERNFKSETVYTAMNMHDRFVALSPVKRRRQTYLVAVSCLYIAAKIAEETIEPSTSDMAIQSEMFVLTRADIKRTERKIAAVLDWNFSPVTPHAIVHEVFNSLGTPDHRPSEFHRPSRHPVAHPNGAPHLAVRTAVFAFLDRAFERLATHPECFSTPPSAMVAKLFAAFYHYRGGMGCSVGSAAALALSAPASRSSKLAVAGAGSPSLEFGPVSASSIASLTGSAAQSLLDSEPGPSLDAVLSLVRSAPASSDFAKACERAMVM